MQPAQLARFRRTEPQLDRAHGHEQETLEHDMRYCMRRCAVDRQRRSNSNRADHEADLVVGRIGQHLAKIILHHGEEHRIDRHRRADPDQRLIPCKESRQQVDRHRRRVGRQHDRARFGRVRIRIRQPVMHQRKRRLDAHARKDQHAPGRAWIDDADHQPVPEPAQLRNQERALLDPIQSNARRQQQPRNDLDRQEPHSRAIGRPRARRKNQQRGSQRRQLRKHHQCDEIAREDRAQRRARIDQPSRILQPVATVQRVNAAQRCSQNEAEPENQR